MNKEAVRKALEIIEECLEENCESELFNKVLESANGYKVVPDYTENAALVLANLYFTTENEEQAELIKAVMELV